MIFDIHNNFCNKIIITKIYLHEQKIHYCNKITVTKINYGCNFDNDTNVCNDYY